jgi:hypothetical protein
MLPAFPWDIKLDLGLTDVLTLMECNHSLQANKQLEHR